MGSSVRRILFVCFGNLCRSPMAEGIFNHLTGILSFVAESAGVGAMEGTPPSLLAVLEMKRRGIDISRHRARPVSSLDVSAFEKVIALDREVAALFQTAFPEYGHLLVWDVADPYGGSAEEYREAADVISAQVAELIHGLS
jgi:protein-tyrosine phosphatase